MAGKATSFDIAQLAGVSQPTVSRALRGSPTVSEPTRLRIEAIARQLNYTVDKNASALRRRTTNTLALLFYEDPVPDESMVNPFFLSMLGSITRTAAQRGYDVLTSIQQMSSDWHADFEESRKADGLILLGHGDFELYRPKLESLIAQGAHFVRWGATTDDPLGITIGSDNLAGGEAAVAHLIARGRRHIAFLGNADSHYPEFRDRYRGAVAAMAAAGIAADPALQVDAEITEASGHAAVRALIDRGVAFDALFCAADIIAIGAIAALEQAGFRVPGDIAVVGFDDIPIASMTRPPLTTVHQNIARAGEVLVDTLLAQIDGRDAPVPPLSVDLVVRASSGAG